MSPFVIDLRQKGMLGQLIIRAVCVCVCVFNEPGWRVTSALIQTWRRTNWTCSSGFLQIDMAETHRVTAQGRKKWTIPQRSATDGSKPSVRAPDQDAQRKLAVPFRGHITGGMRPGRKVVLVGVVEPSPDRFYVALTCGCGTSREPPPDVALELCVRFRDRQVLRRACVSGSWGDVDKAIPFFPFIRDQPFKIEIHCEHGRFRVFVDGQQLFDFSHRLTSLGDIDTLWIKGSISITKLA